MKIKCTVSYRLDWDKYKNHEEVEITKEEIEKLAIKKLRSCFDKGIQKSLKDFSCDIDDIELKD